MRIRESTIHGSQAFGVAVAVILKLVDAPTWAFFVSLGVFTFFWLVSRAVEAAPELP